MRRALAVAAAVVALPSLASAFSGGVSGRSGRPGSGTCGDCHGGAGTATVQITGPSTIFVGEAAAYEVVVTGGGGLTTGGVDVAASGGALAPGPGEKLDGGEVVQAAPLSGGPTIHYQVTLTPSTTGTLTLWAAAIAANGDGAAGGDAPGRATLDVHVGEPPDLAGIDEGPADLAAVDAASSPSAVDMAAGASDMNKPAAAEAVWGCGCRAGGRPAGSGVALVVAAAMVLLLLRRRS